MHSSNAKLCWDGGTLTLLYDYDRYQDEHFVGTFRSGLRFRLVRAYRYRAESHCTTWHVESSYDTLVEIEDSEWVAELRALSTSRKMGDHEMHHYMVYLDSSGSYEIVAGSWEVLPEEEGSWDHDTQP